MSAGRRSGWRVCGAMGALLVAGVAVATEPITPPGRLRDPFTPIGYVPPPPKETPPAALPPVITVSMPTPEMWEEARRSLRVGGVTAIGSRRRALINDRVVGEGDQVETHHRGFLFRWIVDKVEEQGVSLRPVVQANPPPRAGETPTPQ